MVQTGPKEPMEERAVMDRTAKATARAADLGARELPVHAEQTAAMAARADITKMAVETAQAVEIAAEAEALVPVVVVTAMTQAQAETRELVSATEQTV